MIAPVLSSNLPAKVVIDTNVLVAALLRSEGRNRQVIRACLEGRLRPILGEALFLEYEAVLGRTELFRKSPLSEPERQRLLDAFLSVCEWVQIYYSWRPNLRDEADNHILELAVAGGATMIVTNNVTDFRNAELQFPGIRTLTPLEVWKELP